MVTIKIGEKFLETTDADAFSIKITKSIKDYGNALSNTSSFSVDFDVPPTVSNTELLFNVSDVNAIGEVGVVACSIYLDGLKYEEGTLFAFESEYGGDFTCTYQSGLIEWVDPLSALTLNNVVWQDQFTSLTSTDATDTFSEARANALKTGIADNEDLTFPVVNRNNTVNFDDSRPVFYAKKVVKRIFESIGWTVSGGWIDSEELTGNEVITDVFSENWDFKGLLFDPSFTFEIDEDIIEANRVEVTTNKTDNGQPLSAWDRTFTLGNETADPSAPIITTLQNFTNLFDNETTDIGANWDPTGTKYTAPSSGVYLFTFDSDPANSKYGFVVDQTGTGVNFTLSPTVQQPPRVDLFLVKNNVGTATINGTVLYDTTLSLAGIGYSGLVVENIPVSLNTGDELTIFYQIFDTAFGWSPSLLLNAPSLHRWTFKIGDNATVKIQQKPTLSEGDVYRINNHLPSLNTLEIIQDFRLLYNFIFDTDNENKTVRIETWNDYYKGLGEAKNWTDKADLTKKPKINHLSDYKKKLKFMYSSDSSDGYLEKWQKIFNITYGEYEQTLNPAARFEEGETVYSTRLIAPTIQGNLLGSELNSSVIKKEWTTEEETGINEGYKARIYYGIYGVQRYNTGEVRTGDSDLYALMEEYGNIPIYNDLRLTFAGVNGLYIRNWSKVVEMIELGRVVTMNFNISRYEFFNFDFSEPIFLEYPEKLKGYYIVQSINNYDVNQDGKISTEFTLIKYRNFIGDNLDTSQKTNVNENTNDTSGSGLTSVFTVEDEGLPTEDTLRVFTFLPDGSRVLVSL